MDITDEEVGSVTVVAMTGNLDTNTAPSMQEHLDALEGKILVDFSSLDYISSAGLRVLLSTAKRLGGSGGALKLCGFNETVQEVFEISGFNTIFSVHGNRTEALEGF